MWKLTSHQQDQLATIDTWPVDQGSSQFKSAIAVPTEILHEGIKVHWGFQIDSSKPRFQRFKLDLNEKRGHQASYISITYPDRLEKSPSLIKQATELTIDFLKKLYSHIQLYLENKYSRGLLNTTPIQYILTVPAVWSETAKQLTKDCARAAGFGDSIHLIIEPEAAVTHAITVLPSELKIGDTFVCCDAGGGTVDLISYVLEEKTPGKPIKVSEAVRGNGDLCGSTFINNQFREFFLDRFRDVIGEVEGNEIDLVLQAHLGDCLERRGSGRRHRTAARCLARRRVPARAPRGG